MNKLSKCLLLTFALLFAVLFKTESVSAATVKATDTGYMYERQQYSGEGKHHMSDKFHNYFVDGQVSYCIEPNVPYGSGIEVGTWEDTGLPDDIKERVILIAYYGYTYPGHQTLQYRAAAQAMIWETIMRDGFVKVSKDYWGKGAELDISAERAEINRLIDTHYTRPSFNGSVHKVQKGKSVTLTDENNVLSEYNVSVEGAEYSIDGNVLTITPTQSGDIEVNLSKRMPYSSEFKLFVGTKQNMIVPGTSDPVFAGVRIKSFSGSVEGYKKDKETGESKGQGQALLSNAEYGVYEQETGNLVTTFVTDENGFFKTDNVLEAKDYFIQERKQSLGYKLDGTRYNFSMVDKEVAHVDVYEEVIKNYISILKQYGNIDGNTDFLNAEQNIEFQILYPNGNLFDTIKTDKNGYATINLPYGRWKFHQVNSTTGYEKIYDFYITVSETSEKEQYYNILNNTLSAYLQVAKVDEETGKVIAIADTTFKILNTDTNQYVSQYVGGKVYSEFKTDETGKMTTFLKLPASNYKLVEISSPNGYLLDSDGLTFSIGEDTDYQYTNYGAFVSVIYKNTPIKGQLEIYKTGEDMIINDGKFTYEKKPLNDVIFEIYAAEDILTSDGNHMYYKAGTLVEVLTTKNGYAISKQLPLGKYYVIEVKTDDFYVLDKNKHYFELKEVDNKTPLVYESYSNLNYLKKGTIEVTKTDLLTNAPIEDVLIEIYTDKGELVFSGRTSNDGRLTLKDVKVGKYYAIEREAKTGYVLTEEKLYFEIKEDGEVVKGNMKNKPITGSLEFSKIDFSTSEPIPNTLIEVYNADTEEIVFSGRTNESGNIAIPELRYGRYYILERETASPEYILNTEKMYFEIKEDGEVVKATMTNEKIKIPVPITGVNDSHVIEIISGLLVLSGIGVALYAKKKKSN